MASTQTRTQTMRAVRIHRFGGPEVLVFEDIPRPEPRSGELLIKVHAAGVNAIDWKVREGLMSRLSLPLTPGWDFSGVVEDTGLGSRFRRGDAVYGRPDLFRGGAYAEYLVVRETDVAPKPATVDHVHAAAAALSGLTAWQALFDAARLQPGQKVLVHGAAGGVGGFAVQLAKWKGARVFGTASARNREFVRRLGADEVIDYEAVAFDDAVRGLDVVVDTIGGDVQRRSWRVLKRGGILVSTVELPSEREAAARGARGELVAVRASAKQLRELAALVDSGKVEIAVETVLSLADAREAQELSRTHHARGKIVLRVSASA